MSFKPIAMNVLVLSSCTFYNKLSIIQLYLFIMLFIYWWIHELI